MMEHNICCSRLILPVRRLKRRSAVNVYTLSMWGHTIFTTGLKCNEPLTYIGFKTRIHLRFPPVQTLMFNPTDLSSREINFLYLSEGKSCIAGEMFTRASAFSNIDIHFWFWKSVNPLLASNLTVQFQWDIINMQFAKWTELSFLLNVHISKANIACHSVSTESVQYIFLSELKDACHS